MRAIWQNTGETGMLLEMENRKCWASFVGLKSYNWGLLGADFRHPEMNRGAFADPMDDLAEKDRAILVQTGPDEFYAAGHGCHLFFSEYEPLDGASPWYKFVHVTLPLLAPSFTVCVTLSLTGWLREFATTLAATGGGPSNYSQTMAIYICNNLFSYSKAGYGQAVAIVFAIMVIVIGQSVSAFFRRREVQM